MLIRKKIFSCPDTRVGSVFTNGDTVARQEPGAAETIFLAEFYDLAIDTGILEIDTGILLFEDVDLRFHHKEIDAVVLCFKTRDFDRQQLIEFCSKCFLPLLMILHSSLSHFVFILDRITNYLD